MATVVGAIGTSHSPMLLTSPRLWRERADQDRTNPELFDLDGHPVTFEQLQEQAGDAFAGEMSDELWVRRHNACEAGMDRLAQGLQQLAPDVLVVVGDDQDEVFDATNRPSLAVFWGERWQTQHLEGAPPGEFFEAVKTGYAMDEVHEFEGAPELALLAIRHLVHTGFDVASVAATPADKGFGHAYGFVIRRLLGDRDIPVVPVMINTYYPPNQPSAARCYDFGVALRAGLEAADSDARAVLVASGGLSHFVVDKELDEGVLQALRDNDSAYLRSLPDHKLQAGSSEIRNWIAVAGAMAGTPVAWSEYQPCYRTSAGTGCGMGFLRWE